MLKLKHVPMAEVATTAVPRSARPQSPRGTAVQTWRRRSQTLGPVLLATLAALAVAGCPAVTPTTEPEFSGETSGLKFSFAVDREISPVVLPSAVGGSGRLTYSLGPELPPGLNFDGETRTLSGTPTVAGSYRTTYEARDVDGKSAELTVTITITVAPEADSRSIASSVAVGDAAGVARFADLPDPNGGPSVLVSGSVVFAAGGTVFLDIEPEPGAAVDKLLVAAGGDSAGYFEFDVSDATAPHRLRGQVRFDVDSAIDSGCVPVAAVDAGGAVGPVTCHRMSNAAVEFGEVQVTVSWDSDADLDVHVVDATGEEIYFGQRTSGSGGVLDFDSHCRPPRPRPFRNEHVAWSQGTAPEGAYAVRVNHWENCGAEQTNYVVSVYNHGSVSSFSGTFTGPGDGGGTGDGREITRFEVGAGPPPPPRTRRGDARYRGHGDQVFVLNPDGQPLDGKIYTLDLGDATAEVYVIATNTAHHDTNPAVGRLDRLEAAAKGLPTSSAQDHYQPPPRPALSAPVPERAWISAFNNTLPLLGRTSGTSARQRAWSQTGVAEGDSFAFHDRGAVGTLAGIPATARSVVADGSMTVTLWVADDDWGAGCSGAGPCVTGDMVDAMADRFFRPGAGNDIHDWMTAIYGDPWGPHSHASLIPPEAAGQIHVLLFDIDRDGAPGPGECRITGFFSSAHNYLRDPGRPTTSSSAERLIFFMDSAFFAIPEGPTWEVTDYRPSQIIGTLAHEFQHMIHFYQKRVVRGAASPTWLNEMASEVAEDLIAEQMMVNGPRAVAYDDPTAGSPGIRTGRLPIYNLFNDVPVTTWHGRIANYAISYAMGAYLARTYGGAELFSEIVQSDQSGIVAIEAALQALGHDVSFAEVLADWAVATLLSDNTAAPAPYRYNPGTWTTSHAGGEEFRLGSINLYNYRYDPPDPVPDCIGPQLQGRSSQVGPYLHSLQSLSERTQPPHSNAFATLGRNTGTVRLLVSAESENRITVVVKE